MDDIKSFESPELRAMIDKYSPFLTEARKRVVFTLCVFVIATLGGFFFYERMIRFLIEILSLKGINIVFTSPFQFINLAIGCGITTGLVFSFPLLVFQVLSFLRPALRPREYKIIMRLLPFSLILFLIGFAFGTLIMKWQVEIFLDRSISLGIGNILDISRLLSTVLLTSILMGISFEFPIFLLLLMGIGVIKHQQLGKYRLWIYLASFIFAILLPPDSILADIVLTMPLIVLFEITLIMGRFSKKS